MKFASFDNADEAMEHRRNNGGWIFAVSDQPEWIWFHIKYTPTPILLHRATRGLSGKLI